MSVLIYCLCGKLGPSFRNCQQEADKTLHTTKSVQEAIVATDMASCSQQPLNIWRVIWTSQFFAIWNSGSNFRFCGRIQKLLRHWSNSTYQTLTLRPQTVLEVVYFTFWWLYLGQRLDHVRYLALLSAISDWRCSNANESAAGWEGTQLTLSSPPLATYGKVRVLTSSSFETKVREKFGTVNFEEDNWTKCTHPRIQDKILHQKTSPLDVLAVSKLWCAHLKDHLLWPY